MAKAVVADYRLIRMATYNTSALKGCHHLYGIKSDHFCLTGQNFQLSLQQQPALGIPVPDNEISQEAEGAKSGRAPT
jgi:hypothetical protein